MGRGSIMIVPNFPLSGWKNKKGTGERSCKCGSWRNHWLRFSPEPWPTKCAVDGCNNAATLGAHIFLSGTMSPDNEYIIPTCDSCNKLESQFSVKSGTIFVPANRKKTCEK